MQVLCIGWAARAVFIAAVPAKAHSADVDSWIRIAHLLRDGVNPYAATPLLNWPPLWMVLVWVLDHAARTVGISFFLTLRLFLIAVESLVIALVYWYLARAAPTEARRVVLAGLSLNPIAILLVCQHGNFDVLIGLCCLAAAIAVAGYSKTRDVLLWLAGSLALGVGALAKTVPLVLAPLLARGAATSRPLARVIAATLFLGPALLGTAVIFVLTSETVTANVLEYRGLRGRFGLTGLTEAIGASGVTTAFADAVFPAGVAVWLAAGWLRLRRRDLDAPRTLLLTGLVLLAVPVLGPGYAPQYAYWWLPLLVATYPLFDRGWRRLLLAAYAVAGLSYLAEYALLATQGAFLDAFFPGSRFVHDLTGDLAADGRVALLRLPLFLASIAVLIAGARRLGRPDPQG